MLLVSISPYLPGFGSSEDANERIGVYDAIKRTIEY
jgi:hypothetical protein